MNERNEVEIRAESLEPPSWTPELESFIRHALAAIGASGWEVSVLLTDDETIRRLNRTYRGIDEPTDILTFRSAEAELPQALVSPVDPAEREPTRMPVAPGPIGDIVLSLPSIERQAAEFGVAHEEELRRTTIHGLLHLAGHDHESSHPEREPMLQYQESLLYELEGRLF